MLRKYIVVNYILLLVFHMILNGHNVTLKKQWGSLGIAKYSDCTSCKHHGNVLCFVKALKFWGELLSHNLMHSASPDLSHQFLLQKTIFHCLTL